DADDARIALGHVAQPLTKDLRVGRRAGLFLVDRAGGRIKGAGTMPGDRIGLGGRVALALARDYVQQLRSVQTACSAQGAQQRGQVVTVDRAEVVEAHLLEDGSRQQHALDVLLGAARQLAQASQRGYLLESAFAAGAQLRIEAAGDHASEVVRQGTDV